MYVKPRLMVVVGGAFLSPRRAVGNEKVKRTIAPLPGLYGIEAKPSPSKCCGSHYSSPRIFRPSYGPTPLWDDNHVFNFDYHDEMMQHAHE